MHKFDVALEQLEQALKIHLDGGSSWSVLTLAGAAEEIFGQHLRRLGKDNAASDLGKASARVYHWLYGEAAEPLVFVRGANHARNAAKHFGDESGAILEVDAAEAAYDMLDRAVTNYYRLFGIGRDWLLGWNPRLSELVERFNEDLRQAR